MSDIIHMVDEFWKWSECQGNWNSQDISQLSLDPLSFPQFVELCHLCISKINVPLSEVEMEAFLFCMALDYEDECILEACKEAGSKNFLCKLLSVGTTFHQRETRWQMAELLREDIPEREYFLGILLNDENAYVRRRAGNVLSNLNG